MVFLDFWKLVFLDYWNFVLIRNIDADRKCAYLIKLKNIIDMSLKLFKV